VYCEHLSVLPTGLALLLFIFLSSHLSVLLFSS